MGHRTLMVIGNRVMSDLDRYNPSLFDYYQEHEQQVLVPLDSNISCARNYNDGVPLKPHDSMPKSNINMKETSESMFWPPSIVICEGNVFEDENLEWHERFNALWDEISPESTITIYDVHV